MNPKEFLEEVKKSVGGNIRDESAFERGGLMAERGQPRIEVVSRGYHVVLDFIIQEELHFMVRHTPPRLVSVRAWNFLHRLLSFLRLEARVPTGDPRFDAAFLVQYVSEKEMGTVLPPKVREAIWKLSPFYEFELTERLFRMLKEVTPHYTPEMAIQDLDTLLDLVDHFFGGKPPVPTPGNN